MFASDLPAGCSREREAYLKGLNRTIVDGAGRMLARRIGHGSQRVFDFLASVFLNQGM